MMRQVSIKPSTHSKFFNLFTSTALLLLGLLAALLMPPVSSQTNSDGAGQATNAPPCSTCPEPTQQTIYAPTIGLPEATRARSCLTRAARA